MAQGGLDFFYDEERDVVRLCGMEYAAELFRHLAFADPGSWFRIEERKSGTITIFCPNESTRRAFDVLTGKGFMVKP